MLYNWYVRKEIMMKWKSERKKAQREGAWMPLLADLLQDLAGGLPSDSLQSEQTHREPLRQQALQRAVQVLGERKKKVRV